MRLESINVGAVERIVHGKKSHDTGIRKLPVNGAVRVTALGLPGDAIVSTAHHGGPDQAIYAYSTDDYDWWNDENGHDFFPGLFGENLTIRDLPTDMHVGDRLLIGEVVLEATSPRIPCGTFATRMQDSGFGVKFREAERPGIYFRVLNEGEISAGDVVTLVECAAHDVSIVELFRYKYALKHDPAELQRLLEAPLAERMRADIERKLATINPD